MNHEGIQKSLLAEELTFEKASNKAQAIEAAEADSKNIKAVNQTTVSTTKYFSTIQKEAEKKLLQKEKLCVTERCGGNHLAPPAITRTLNATSVRKSDI